MQSLNSQNPGNDAEPNSQNPGNDAEPPFAKSPLRGFTFAH